MVLPLMEGSSDCSTSIFRFFTALPIYNHAKLQTITETHIQTRKLRAVSVFVSYPPFFNSIFRQANTPFSQNRQYPTPFYLSALYYHGNPGLLRESILLPDSIILPLSPSYQRHPKTKKLGSTTHRDEPHQTSKSLDFKPFFHTFACEYQNSYGIIWK